MYFVLLILAGMSGTCISQMGNSTLVKRGARDGDERVPEECRGLTYCTEKGEHYPEEKINKMLEDKCLLPFPTPVSNAYARAEDVERGSSTEFDNNCEARVTYTPVYSIKKDGMWYMVPQIAPKNFVSKIRLETCVQEGHNCFSGAGFSSDVTTKCKPEYVNWDFWAYADDDDESFVKVTASLPVCCTCNYKVDATNDL